MDKKMEGETMVPGIFVGGSGRSGTTLLVRLLGGHKDIHAFPN
ncbi:MAG: sulfotransferase, partial [bacterium]|nr:sulfotransferase [bacterium]